MTAFPALVPRNWRDSAACRGTDPDLFFPVADGGASAAQAAEAKQVCLACPVRSPCLDWAVRHSPEHGVWGGTVPGERAAARLSLTRGAA